jgi:hypothetical protein
MNYNNITKIETIETQIRIKEKGAPRKSSFLMNQNDRRPYLASSFRFLYKLSQTTPS